MREKEKTTETKTLPAVVGVEPFVLWGLSFLFVWVKRSCVVIQKRIFNPQSKLSDDLFKFGFFFFVFSNQEKNI